MESLKLQEGVVESLVTIRASAGVSGRHERVKSFEMQTPWPSLGSVIWRIDPGAVIAPNVSFQTDYCSECVIFKLIMFLNESIH